MNTVGGFSFDALANFVQRANETLESNPLDAARLDSEQSFRDEQRDIVQQLDGSIREAQARKQQPAEKLLRDVRGAVSTRTPDQKPDPKLADQLEHAGETLKNQDTFGDQAAFKLPPVFERAIGFLKTAFDAPQPKATPEGQPVRKPTGELQIARPQIAPEPHVENRDPRVGEFLQKYFGDGFETKPAAFTERQLVAALPHAERQALQKLPEAERKFLLSLDSKQQPAYAAMPKEEQTFFRSMKPSERGQYLAMSPDERAFFRDLKPDERASYIALHPDQREVIRQEGAPALKPQSQFEKLEKKEPVEVARELSTEVLQTFDMKPVTEDVNGKHAQLEEKTRQLMMNFLQADPKNAAAAKVQTFRALLDQPEFQNQLMKDLEGQLSQQDPKLASHFKKIRPLVMEQAQKLVRPDMTRESLLGGLAKAVEVSHEFALQNPPRRRDLRVSGNLQFRFIAG